MAYMHYGTIYLVLCSKNYLADKVENIETGRPDKRAGCIFFENLINGQFLIRAGRVEFFWEINRWACPFIRQ